MLFTFHVFFVCFLIILATHLREYRRTQKSYGGFRDIQSLMIMTGESPLPSTSHFFPTVYFAVQQGMIAVYIGAKVSSF